MKFLKISEAGFYDGDAILLSHPMVSKEITNKDGEKIEVMVPDEYYTTLNPVGFHKPKWDFDNKCWTEGKLQKEIDAVIAESKKENLSDDQKKIKMLEAQVNASKTQLQFQEDLIVELATLFYNGM